MKKNLIILAVAIAALVIIILLTNKQKPVPLPENNPAQEITPASIENDLNTINVDSGIDEDIKAIDADIGTL